APLPTRALRLRNGDTLISDQFNNRVIRIDSSGNLLASYGLPLTGGGTLPIPATSPVGVNEAIALRLPRPGFTRPTMRRSSATTQD
ncbi:MAG TPA: hypothetical protein VKV04_22125, partial [Verrucomicrobiae bacterium]|nr:hypothetical protein [Verrucomicrobiae bacterium]